MAAVALTSCRFGDAPSTVRQTPSATVGPPSSAAHSGAVDGTVEVDEPIAVDPGVCRERARKLAEWLDVLVAEGDADAVPRSPEMRLVRVPIPPSSVDDGEVGPWVHILEDRVEVNGRLASQTRRGMPSTLVELLTDARVEHPTESLLLLIDREVTWGDIAPIVDAAGAVGFQRVTFLFEGTTRLPSPDPSDLDTALRAPIQPEEKAQILTQGYPALEPGAVYSNCGQARALYAIETSPSGDTRLYGQKIARMTQAFTLIAARLPKAIVECGCNVDFATVQAAFFNGFGRYGSRTAGKAAGAKVPLVGTTVRLPPPHTKAVVVSFATDAPWHQTHQSVRKHAREGRPVRLVVESHP